MSNSYDDSRYGVVQRKWFGLTKKWGGETAAGYTFGTTDATAITHLKYWYPKGPIKIVKIGVGRICTTTNASVDLVPVRFYTRGGSASLVGTVYFKSTTTAQAPAIVAASAISLSYTQCKAGEYISIVSGTPQTDKGTAANTATTAGTAAFFVDWVPKFDTKWDT